MGPVINQRAVNNFQRLVDDAIARGAELRTGGSAPKSAGYFYEATVLDRVPAGAVISNTEIFGPIATISRFSTLTRIYGESRSRTQCC